MKDNYIPVSVIIPCYCCSATIERAIKSVINQKQKPLEVILVDDGNKTDTKNLLRQIEKNHPNWIKVIELDQNKGAGFARNIGWEAANYKYIAFLDADDSWHTEKLSIQYEFMINHPNITLCGHQCVFLLNNQQHPKLVIPFQINHITRLSLLFKNAFSTPTVMLKSDIEYRFLDGKRHSEDYLLWQQIAFSDFQIARLETPLAYVHKPFYGSEGLSGQHWKMEKGEIQNFFTLYDDKLINIWQCLLGVSFSLIKYIKRIISIKVNQLIQ